MASDGASIVDALVLPDRVIVTGSDDAGAAAWVSFDGLSWLRSSVAVDHSGPGDTERLGPVYEVADRLMALGFPSRVGATGPPIGYVSVDGGLTWSVERRFVWDAEMPPWDGGGDVEEVIADGPAMVAVGLTWPAWAIYRPNAGIWISEDGLRWEADDPKRTRRKIPTAFLIGSEALGTDVFAFGRFAKRGTRYVPAMVRTRGDMPWGSPMWLDSAEGSVLDLHQVSGPTGEILAGGAITRGNRSLAAIWSSLSGSEWGRELLVKRQSVIRAMHELSDGSAVALGEIGTSPTMWFRMPSGRWVDAQLDNQRATVHSVVDFNGRLIVLGSRRRTESHIDYPDRIVSWTAEAATTSVSRRADGVVPVPTSPPVPPGGASSCEQALLAGELVSDTEMGFAVERRGDSGRFTVVWPFGYVASDTAEGRILMDAAGRIVAREGDQVELAGGYGVEGFPTCGLPMTLSGHVECEIPYADCDLALRAANAVVHQGVPHSQEVLVAWGRGLEWHVEVHACWADGTYVLIDVIGAGTGARPSAAPSIGDVEAAIRADGWADPPCD